MKRGTAYINAGRERIKKDNHYSMSMGELEDFIETACNEDIITAIANAYYMGIEAGARMTKKSITA